MTSTSPRPLSALGLLLALCFALPGCDSDDGEENGPGPDTTGTTDDPGVQGQAELDIVSPQDGASYMAGEPVILEVKVVNDSTGAEMSYDSVTWSAQGWSYDQAQGTVTDLPVGSYDLQVAASVDGRELDGAVSDLTIEQVHDPVSYQGPLDATVYLESYEYGVDDEGACDGTVMLETDQQWLVTGGGSCHVSLFWGYVEWDVDFEIDGTRTEDTVEGDLFFYDTEGTRYYTPYSGTVIGDERIYAEFSLSESTADGELAFWGSFDVLALQ